MVSRIFLFFFFLVPFGFMIPVLLLEVCLHFG